MKYLGNELGKDQAPALGAGARQSLEVRGKDSADGMEKERPVRTGGNREDVVSQIKGKVFQGRGRIPSVRCSRCSQENENRELTIFDTLP